MTGTATVGPVGSTAKQRCATEPVVRISGLSVTTTGKAPATVLSGIDLELAAGEVLGVVGESGSGKTTVALALLGYGRPGMVLDGSVRVGGVEMVGAEPDVLRRARGAVISYVPQDPTASLNPARRIGAQLRERLKVHDRWVDDPETRLVEVLARVQLPSDREFLRRYPHQLSGGQLQRVCIAMAVLCRPRVIVLDEPTTGLDVTTQSHVLGLLRDVIADEQTAALYVTHDLAVVSAVASRLAVVYAGMLVEEGPTELLMRRPDHPYTRGLIRSTPSLFTRGALVGIAGIPLSPGRRGPGCPFAERCELVVDACRQTLPDFRAVAFPAPHGGGAAVAGPVLSGAGGSAISGAVASGGGSAEAVHRVRCLRAGAVELRRPRRSQGPSSSPAASAVAVMQADRLDAFYGSNQALHDVTLRVGAGECLAIVGESGSGKTTLARCLSGLHAGRARGTLLFENREIPFPAAARTRDERRRIQYVFQSPFAALNPRHTLARSIGLPLELAGAGHDERRRRVRELLDRVALGPGYETRYPSQLSGGERQRVAIARALAAEPAILVCDEITSALDVSIQASILDLLGELRRDLGLTMLFITHHLALVRAVADRGLVMQQGRIVEEGTAAELLDTPQHAYTQALIRDTPAMPDDRRDSERGTYP